MHEVRVGLEEELDLGQLRDRIRAQDVERREPGERLLQGHGDERLHLVGRQAQRSRLDLDARWREFGKDIDRRRAQFLHPEEHRPDGDRDDDEAIAQAGRDHPAKHRSALYRTRALIRGRRRRAQCRTARPHRR